MQIDLILSFKWDPYQCVLRGTLLSLKSSWIYRKWRHKSRKMKFGGGKRSISNTLSIFYRMSPILIHFMWYLSVFKFPWIYRKWRHSSRKMDFGGGKWSISNTFSIFHRMSSILIHFMWYFRHFSIFLDLQEMTS